MGDRATGASSRLAEFLKKSDAGTHLPRWVPPPVLVPPWGVALARQRPTERSGPRRESDSRVRYDARGVKLTPGWHVTFSTGDVTAVARERDMMTTESVLKSRQVELRLGQLKRKKLLAVTVQGSLIFLGVLWISTWPWVRRLLE